MHAKFRYFIAQCTLKASEREREVFCVWIVYIVILCDDGVCALLELQLQLTLPSPVNVARNFAEKEFFRFFLVSVHRRMEKVIFHFYTHRKASKHYRLKSLIWVFQFKFIFHSDWTIWSRARDGGIFIKAAEDIQREFGSMQLSGWKFFVAFYFLCYLAIIAVENDFLSGKWVARRL